MYGFTCGNGAEDDLPQRMTTWIEHMKNGIWKLLSKKDMFPANSKYPTITMQANGDGYMALKQIMMLAHPSFLEQPALMICSPPVQSASHTVLG